MSFIVRIRQRDKPTQKVEHFLFHTHIDKVTAMDKNISCRHIRSSVDADDVYQRIEGFSYQRTMNYHYPT